jgi:hypothetical protein
MHQDYITAPVAILKPSFALDAIGGKYTAVLPAQKLQEQTHAVKRKDVINVPPGVEYAMLAVKDATGYVRKKK